MVKKLPFYVNYISIKSCLLEILSWLYSHWYLGYWVVLVIYCCIINYHGLGGLKWYIYYLTVYVGQNSRYNVTEFFASWSLTRLQSRGQPGLESHLKVQLVRINFQSYMVAGRIHYLASLFSWEPQFFSGCRLFLAKRSSP